MLVLSRKKGESVCIGDEITVTVVEIRGDKVRVGFTGPKEVPIHRKEVYDVIHKKAPDKPDSCSWEHWNRLNSEEKLQIMRADVQEGETD